MPTKEEVEQAPVENLEAVKANLREEVKAELKAEYEAKVESTTIDGL